MKMFGHILHLLAYSVWFPFDNAPLVLKLTVFSSVELCLELSFKMYWLDCVCLALLSLLCNLVQIHFSLDEGGGDTFGGFFFCVCLYCAFSFRQKSILLLLLQC